MNSSKWRLLNRHDLDSIEFELKLKGKIDNFFMPIIQ